MSNCLQPHGLQPARLLCPWDSPGKNTGVGLPCPPPGDLPDPEIKLARLLCLLHWQTGSLPLAAPGEPKRVVGHSSGFIGKGAGPCSDKAWCLSMPCPCYLASSGNSQTWPSEQESQAVCGKELSLPYTNSFCLCMAEEQSVIQY